MACIERRSVTSRYHGHNLHSRKTEEKYELLFCSWVQSRTGKPYMSNFSLFFFLPYLQNHGLLRSRNFVTMVRWRNDIFSLLETYKLNRSIWFYASTEWVEFYLEKMNKWTNLRYLTKGCSCGLSRLTGLARLTKYFLCKKFNMFIWI